MCPLLRCRSACPTFRPLTFRRPLLSRSDSLAAGARLVHHVPRTEDVTCGVTHSTLPLLQMKRGEWMQPLRILIVVTSHAALGDTGKPTGVWLEELAVPYIRFIDAGADVTVTSIMGGKIPLDPRSTPPTGPVAPVVERFLANPAVARTL